MNLIIPFTKDIKFNSNISEIVSISLEHEYTVNDSGILGNFIVLGDYKTHEVSVNKEHFEHVLPFSVDITKKIDTDSVDFSIEDFTYEIVDKNILRVNIEYSINALEVKEEPKEEVINDSIEDILDNIDEEIKNNDIDERNEEQEMITQEQRDANIAEEDKNTIINGVSNTEDSFVTYNIHIMQETDTIDIICAKYNTEQAILGEYNDLSNIAVGDKIIIPEINE